MNHIHRWILLAIIGTGVVVAAGARLSLQPKRDALLNGPPEFILLATVVALAAYLRQVSLHANETRDKMKHDDTWNYPSGENYTKRKMAELEGMEGQQSAVAEDADELDVLCTRRGVAFPSPPDFAILVAGGQ